MFVILYFLPWQVTWIRIHDGKTLTVDRFVSSLDPRVHIDLEKEHRNLVIKGAYLNDSGIYKCQSLQSPKKHVSVEIEIKGRLNNYFINYKSNFT